MRLSLVKSKNSTQFYVIKSYRDKNGKNTSKIIEKLGNLEQVTIKANGKDPVEWAKEYITMLNHEEKEVSRKVIAEYSPTKIINPNTQVLFNGGYIFLQDIYYDLKLDKICKNISKEYKFEFDLNSILSYLIYGRVIFPSSKKATKELSSRFIEQPNFDLHHIYRALEVLSKESDGIQSQLYKNSLNICDRNDKILFYDCTNFFFEIEQEEGLKKYGISKEHRPNPIVQMGLFMDGNGIPLAFSINEGNTNEQVTLKPLEEKIISDFELSKFVVCTDAGLASNANRKFNDKNDRAFITTQSVKKLKKHLMEWALSPIGWKLSGSNTTYDISSFSDSDEVKYKDATFYKERWINENGIEQKMIVSYSVKYRKYQKQIRDSQIERAEKTIATNTSKLNKHGNNDYKRFIKSYTITEDGEVAKKKAYFINQEVIAKEEKFDGYYAVCTNLEDSISDIIKINQRRWEIEESFRIMKSEFKARPVYLKRDDRIKAHFITCFISLMIYRLLEKKLDEKYTCNEIVEGLRNMNFMELSGEGYIPAYVRNEFTDDLHKVFKFRTDYQIVKTKEMKRIFKFTKT